MDSTPEENLVPVADETAQEAEAPVENAEAPQTEPTPEEPA